MIARIGFLMLALSSPCWASGVKTAPVERELKDILSQPEYNRDYHTAAWEDLWRRIGEFVERILSWFASVFSSDRGTAGRLASFVFACLVLLAFLLLLAFVIRRLVRMRSAAGAVSKAAELDSYELPSPKPLIKRAEQLAASGDFRGAFRCAYLASIAFLDEIGALRYERSRTNWEYLRELGESGHDDVRADLRPLTLDFDRKFYGREECVEDDYLRAVGVFRKLSAEARA